MRLKYKRLVIIFTVAIMFIGLSVFSLVAPTIDFSSGSDGKKSDSSEIVAETISDEDIQSTVDELVEKYFDAKQKVDLDTIAECVSDAGQVDEKRLVTEAEYIEAYENISCTIKSVKKDSSYRVYVYYEVKIYDIDTLVPSLTALYVTKEKDGSFKIYLGSLDTETQETLEKFDDADDIKKMADSVQKKLEDIVSSNEEVRKFYEMLESSDESNEAVDDSKNIDNEKGSATKAPSSRKRK